MYEVDIIALRVEMAKAGFNTIEDLSKETGVNRNTLATVVKGESYPSSMVMSRIAAALNLSGETAGKIFFKEKLA